MQTQDQVRADNSQNVTIINGRAYVSWARACEIVTACAVCNTHMLGGDEVWNDIDPATLVRVAMREFGKMLRSGAIDARVMIGVKPRKLTAPAKTALSELADGGPAPSVLSSISVDLGQLRSHLLLDPGAFIAKLSTSEVTPLRRLLLTPCEAITLRACGGIWTPEQIRARIALDICARNWLRDHIRGVVELSPDAKSRAKSLIAHCRAWQKAFKDATASYEAEIIGGAVQAYSNETGAALTIASFCAPIILDPLHNKFVPALHLAIGTPEWDVASERCRRIGPLLLGADARSDKRARTTNLALRRADEMLRAWCEAWLRGDVPQPRKEHWLAEGAKILGTKNAAAGVWAKVSAEPRYAALRDPGRPKIKKSKSVN